MKYLLLLSILFFAANCGKNDTADLVILNGKILTLEDAESNFEAVAVKSDTIYKIGTSKEIEKLIGTSTEIIDAEGKLVMPGIIDAHAHFMMLGETLTGLDLKDAKNWDEVVSMVADAAKNAEPGEWIFGRGWHQEHWTPVPEPNVHGYPLHDKLSQAVPDNPVVLNHGTGHAVFANKKAMDIAGVTNNTETPKGGTILKDEKGNPIGVFEEDAEYLIMKHYNKFLEGLSPEKLREKQINAALASTDLCAELGITTFHDAGESVELINLYKQLASEGKLKNRLYCMFLDSNENIELYAEKYRMTDDPTDMITIRAIKKFVDGAIGSRGALLFEDYNDLPGYKGQQVNSTEEIKETARIAKKYNYQLCTHAIGDKGNNIVLDIYEEFLAGEKNLRWRIEHAQHLSPKDIPRFKELGVIASMQTNHATSDGIFVEKRLGYERSKFGAYVWRSLIDAGATVANGTDSPVELLNPFINMYSAVTRELGNGNAFFPEQSMTRMEVIEAYTKNAAYAGFQEDIKGSIKEGKLADIIIVDRDILEVPIEEIKDAKPVYTILGGKVVYKKS